MHDHLKMTATTIALHSDQRTTQFSLLNSLWEIDFRWNNSLVNYVYKLGFG